MGLSSRPDLHRIPSHIIPHQQKLNLCVRTSSPHDTQSGCDHNLPTTFPLPSIIYYFIQSKSCSTVPSQSLIQIWIFCTLSCWCGMVHRLNIFYIALIGMLIRHSTSYSACTKRVSYSILKQFDDKLVGSDTPGNRRPISAYAKHFGRRHSEGSSRQPAYGHFEGDHIYGVNPVLLAIKSGRRKITELLVQSGLEVADKTLDSGSSEILRLCSEAGIDVKSFSKHDLNMLTENRPHQG